MLSIGKEHVTALLGHRLKPSFVKCFDDFAPRS
jgi:hypothetical protein